MSKTFRLGNRIRYPITIVKLFKSPGDHIKRQEPLLQYSFKWMKEVGDTIRGETRQEEQTTIVPWDSPADGELKQWHIREGQRIEADVPCMVVKEACGHEIQFHGLCGICGKDMTEVNWAAENRDTDRATIAMVHDQTELTVSADHAHRTEQALQQRLLENRKLSLVVDLDQTIIQACIDPTVGEWQKDPTNPNHESVKEVQVFQLDDGPYALARRCSYYIKMRPGLKGFLQRISEMYELHVYTMGTRAYAQNVARVVDPDKRLFGDRVISRDENRNIHTKSLQRLFPVSTHMVVIIDDRSDVWPRNRPNLIKVTPYEFFKGIGDINSSFLPKRQDLLTSSSTNGVSKGKRKKETPAKDDPAAQAMAGNDDPALTQRQLEDQERILEKQIKDRPLQALQEKLDREDEEAEKASTQSEDGSESRSSSPAPHRHRVLQDDDDELAHLERHLAFLHQTYFSQYDANLQSTDTAAAAAAGTTAVPDVGQILDQLKSTVLRGARIVLSGVLPRGVDIYQAEIGMQIMSFGAELLPKITRDVTHLVVNAAQPGSEKLMQARRMGKKINIVGLEWLAECFRRWEWVGEDEYRYEVGVIGEGEGEGGKMDVEGVEEDGEVGDGMTNGKGVAERRGKGLRVRLVSASGLTREIGEDEEDDEEEEGELDEDEDDEEGLLPDDIEDGQMSPIDGLKTFNWGSAEEELNEFLASGSSDEEDEDYNDDEDEDNEDKDEDYVQKEESTSSAEEEEKKPRRSRSRSRTASPSSASRKRKHQRDDEGTGSEEDNSAAAPAEEEDEQQAKRLRRTKSPRVSSSLRNQYVAAEGGAALEREGGSLPTPGGTGDEEEEKGGAGKDDEGEMELDDFDEAALEADFEAEFDKVEEEAEEARRNSLGEQGQVGEKG